MASHPLPLAASMEWFNSLLLTPTPVMLSRTIIPDSSTSSSLTLLFDENPTTRSSCNAMKPRVSSLPSRSGPRLPPRFTQELDEAFNVSLLGFSHDHQQANPRSSYY